MESDRPEPRETSGGGTGLSALHSDRPDCQSQYQRSFGRQLNGFSPADSCRHETQKLRCNPISFLVIFAEVGGFEAGGIGAKFVCGPIESLLAVDYHVGFVGDFEGSAASRQRRQVH